MPLPQILVDDERCRDPMVCRRCLRACPTRVLGLGTSVGPEKYKEINPRYFIVRSVRDQFCTACLKCVAVCPTDAIRVIFNGGEAA